MSRSRHDATPPPRPLAGGTRHEPMADGTVRVDGVPIQRRPIDPLDYFDITAEQKQAIRLHLEVMHARDHVVIADAAPVYVVRPSPVWDATTAAFVEDVA